MMQWVNSGSITFETGYQIGGKVTIEDYACKVLKMRAAQKSNIS